MSIQTVPSTFVIIDPSVDNIASLVNGVIDGAQVYLLDAHRDGVQQITEILQWAAENYLSSNYSSSNHSLPAIEVHLMTHGAPGTLYLGNSELSLANLSQYADDLTAWFSPKSKIQNPKSNLLLYGCNVAAGDAGTEFLEKLHHLTGADIAASTTPIGHATLGGNWHLDYQLGQPSHQPVLAAHTRHAYSSVLNSTNLTNFSRGKDVLDFELSLDGSTITYLADQGTNNVFELFTVPVSGGDATKRSSTTFSNTTETLRFIGDENPATADPNKPFSSFYELANNSVITFIGAATDARNSSDTDLFAGFPNSSVRRVRGSADEVRSFKISANGLNILSNEDGDLFLDTTNGGDTTTPLNPSSKELDSTNSYQFGANDANVVFLVDDGIIGNEELYTIPAGSNNPNADRVRLDGITNGISDIFDFQLTPDRTKVVYLSNQNSLFNDLYVTAVDGSINRNASALTNLDPNASDVREYDLTNNFAVYLADKDAIGVQELYSVPLTGNPLNGTKLNVSLNGNKDVDEFSISPDGNTVAYIADQDTVGVRELYTVPIGGGTPTKLNAQLADGLGDVEETYVFSPDSSTIVYEADQDTAKTRELYSVPTGGGNPIPLIKDTLNERSVIYDFRVTPDNDNVVYLVDRDGENIGRGAELYSVPINGSTAPTRLNGNLVPGGEVINFEIANDGTIIYQADEKINETFDLFRATIPAPPGLTANFTTASQSPSEAGGPITITVQLSGGVAPTSGVRIPFNISGTATEGDDYTIATSSATISAGATETTITVEPEIDAVVDPDETIIVTMNGPTNAVKGDTAVQTITLTDGISGGTLGQQVSIDFAQGVRGERGSGNDGNDRILGGLGNDTLRGGDGNDVMRAGNGNDKLRGGDGNDRTFGGRGDDNLRGDDGRDRLVGQAGNDILIGGAGRDVLIGGVGNDMFVYRNLSEGSDIIQRFEVEKDVIDLRRIFSRAEFSVEGTTNFERLSQFVTLNPVGNSTEIRIDEDGIGAGTNTALLATTQDITGLTSDNFVI